MSCRAAFVPAHKCMHSCMHVFWLGMCLDVHHSLYSCVYACVFWLGMCLDLHHSLYSCVYACVFWLCMCLDLHHSLYSCVYACVLAVHVSGSTPQPVQLCVCMCFGCACVWIYTLASRDVLVHAYKCGHACVQACVCVCGEGGSTPYPIEQCLSIYMSISMYVCVQACICFGCVCVWRGGGCMDLHIHWPKFVYVHMCTCMCLDSECVCACVRACVHACVSACMDTQMFK